MMLSRKGQEFLELMRSDGHRIGINQSKMELPNYYNESKVKRYIQKRLKSSVVKICVEVLLMFVNAQRMFHKNYFAMMFAMYIGLVAILAVSPVLNILIHTKRSSSVVTAYRRYMKTILHTFSWFRSDLKEGTKAWQSLLTVRNMHRISSRLASSANVGMITQKDLALTQFSFVGFIVLFKKQLGVQCSSKEMEDFCHFWRVVGHLHGINEEFNLCCDRMDETIERLQIVQKEFLVTVLTSPPSQIEEMSRYAVSGLQCFDFIDCYEPIIFMMKRLVGVPDYQYLESEIPENIDRSKLKYLELSYFDRVNLFISVMSRQYLLNVCIFRWFYNILGYIFEFFMLYLPIIAIIRFGPRKAYVKI